MQLLLKAKRSALAGRPTGVWFTGADEPASRHKRKDESMTTCFLTGKTYPDYVDTDAEQRADFQAQLYKTLGSWGCFVNHEQTQMAIECAKLLVNLNNNNPEAFKMVLNAINKEVNNG